MSAFVIAIVIIAAIVAAVVLLSIWLARKRKELGIIRKTDYRVFTKTGIAMIVMGSGGLVGMFFSNIPFITVLPLLAIGAIYLAIGLNHKEEWATN